MKELFDSTVALSPPTATLLVSLVLPLLVAALTKLVAPAWVKSLVNLLLATALAVITLLSQAGVDGVPLKRVLSLVVVTLVTSNLAYSTIWKPLGVWPLIQKWSSGFGFGGGANEQPMNPDTVLTPPPGGFGESHMTAQLYLATMEQLANPPFTMETGIGFAGDGQIVSQISSDGGALPGVIGNVPTKRSRRSRLDAGPRTTGAGPGAIIQG